MCFAGTLPTHCAGAVRLLVCLVGWLVNCLIHAQSAPAVTLLLLSIIHVPLLLAMRMQLLPNN